MQKERKIISLYSHEERIVTRLEEKMRSALDQKPTDPDKIQDIRTAITESRRIMMELKRKHHAVLLDLEPLYIA